MPGQHFRLLAINPASSAGSYIGQGNNVEVQFTLSPDASSDDVFPEPPLVVRHRQDGSACNIDGGIWVRKAVCLDANKQRLQVQEYSGSNSALQLYRTRDCKRLQTLDVSTQRWQVQGNTVRLGKQCMGASLASCKSRRQRPLTPAQNK